MPGRWSFLALAALSSCGGQAVARDGDLDPQADGDGGRDAGRAYADASDASPRAMPDGDSIEQCDLAGSVRDCSPPDGPLSQQTCDGPPGEIAWGACEPLPCTGTTLTCVLDGGGAGLTLCQNDEAVSLCAAPTNCVPGEICGGPNGGTAVCNTILDGQWGWNSSVCSTPLVLSLDAEPVTFTHASGSFDLFGREASLASDWVSARTPWLALDLDGNGRIDDGRELFGSMTELPDGRRASNGFEALAALDADGDGAVTPRDPSFDRLLVWRDADQDRRCTPDELRPLRDEGVTRLPLAYEVDRRCTSGGCEIEHGALEWRDARGGLHGGTVVDVHLAAW
jgi:hypothetical protein